VGLKILVARKKYVTVGQEQRRDNKNKHMFNAYFFSMPLLEAPGELQY
jgi:hypothetical protein